MVTGHSSNTHANILNHSKQRAWNRNRLYTNIPHVHRDWRNANTPSQAAHGHERDTLLHVNRLLNPSLHHLRSAPARRQRTLSTYSTDAKLYETELDSLSPILDKSSFCTHIHTVYTNRTLDTIPASTILGTTPVVGTTPPSLLTGTEEAKVQTPNAYNRNLLLHCPALQTHRALHHIHALQHIWERPQETVAFLRDTSTI